MISKLNCFQKYKNKTQNEFFAVLPNTGYMVPNAEPHTNITHQKWNLQEKKRDFLNSKGDTKRICDQFGLHIVENLESFNVKNFPKISYILKNNGYNCNFIRQMANSLIVADNTKKITIEPRELKKLSKNNCDLIFAYYYMKNGEQQIYNFLCKFLPENTKNSIISRIMKNFDEMKLESQESNEFQWLNYDSSEDDEYWPLNQ